MSSIRTAMTVAPPSGQTQLLSDVLANPNLTAQGALQILVIGGTGTVEADDVVPS